MSPLKKAQANARPSIARATGIPTTKAGRRRKAEKIESQLIGWAILVGLVVWLFNGQ